MSVVRRPQPRRDELLQDVRREAAGPVPVEAEPSARAGGRERAAVLPVAAAPGHASAAGLPPVRRPDAGGLHLLPALRRAPRRRVGSSPRAGIRAGTDA